MVNIKVYISAMRESLDKKKRLMEKLLEDTKQQAALLEMEHMSMDQFDELLQEKETLLEQITTLDNGFTGVLQKISPDLQQQKQSYQRELMEMQELIRQITDIGVSVEGQERKNKEKFQAHLVRERQEIKKSRQSNRTAVSYYQNMPEQHRAWQTYFVDQKK